MASGQGSAAAVFNTVRTATGSGQFHFVGIELPSYNEDGWIAGTTWLKPYAGRRCCLSGEC